MLEGQQLVATRAAPRRPALIVMARAGCAAVGRLRGPARAVRRRRSALHARARALAGMAWSRRCTTGLAWFYAVLQLDSPTTRQYPPLATFIPEALTALRRFVPKTFHGAFALTERQPFTAVVARRPTDTTSEPSTARQSHRRSAAGRSIPRVPSNRLIRLPCLDLPVWLGRLVDRNGQPLPPKSFIDLLRLAVASNIGSVLIR
jgi:hypothetical protein